MKILITGVAGFIGSFTAQRLLSRGDLVVGIDNLNDYYDVKLKSDRLAQLQCREGFDFHQLDVSDSKSLHKLFDSSKPEFTWFEWFFLLFCAGIGISVTVWGMVEPLYYLKNLPHFPLTKKTYQ